MHSEGQTLHCKGEKQEDKKLLDYLKTSLLMWEMEFGHQIVVCPEFPQFIQVLQPRKVSNSVVGDLECLQLICALKALEVGKTIVGQIKFLDCE